MLKKRKNLIMSLNKKYANISSLFWFLPTITTKHKNEDWGNLWSFNISLNNLKGESNQSDAARHNLCSWFDDLIAN